MQLSLLICIVIFLISLILLERLSVIKILIRFILSLLIIYGYIVAISTGKSIILFSILLVFCLSIINIFIKNGIHKKTFSELFSVFITEAITGCIIFIICKNVNPKIFQDEIMKLNGIKRPENAIFGIYVIISLGIFMDIISRIIYCLDEEKNKTIDIPWKEQFKSGIEIGKKYLSEKINIIILFLLGVSLFPVCLNINNNINILDVYKQPEIFMFVLLAIVSCIGVVFSVLVTSCMYAFLNRKKTIYKTVSENKLDGRRSLKL